MYYPDNEDEKTVNDEENVNKTPDGDETIRPEDEATMGEDMSPDTVENEQQNDIETDDYTVKSEEPEEPAPAPHTYYSAPAPEHEPPKKKKGFYVSGAAIAVLLVCVIIFVGVMSIGIWKIADYMNAPADTSTTNEPASTSETPSGSSEPQSSQQSTIITPSGDSSPSGAAISPASTVTSNTATVETDMIAQCRRASVEISLYSGNTLVGNGSGVIYTTDGYILTNYHVAESVENGTRTAVVTLYDGSKYEATYVLGDMDRDVAVIKIDKNDCDKVVIGNSDASVIGERIYAIGNPNGDGITVTEGIISAKNHTTTVRSTKVTIKNEDVFLVTAPINAGNSGGGVFNVNGELIGLVNSKTYYDKSGNVVEGEGMVIPISRIVECINTLIENNGYIPGKAKLGITVTMSGKTLTSGWNSLTYYTYVTEVKAGSGAEAAGIKEGDIISAVGGVNLQQYKTSNNLMSDYDALHMILLDYKTGDTTTVTVLRPESSSSSSGYQTVTYKEITLDFTFLDFNYSK